MGQYPAESNRSDPICFSPYLYRARNRVERFFKWIKQCRRVAMRYDVHAILRFTALVPLKRKSQTRCDARLMNWLGEGLDEIS